MDSAGLRQAGMKLTQEMTAEEPERQIAAEDRPPDVVVPQNDGDGRSQPAPPEPFVC